MITLLSCGRIGVKRGIFFPHHQLDPAIFLATFRGIVVGPGLQTSDANRIKALFVDAGVNERGLHGQRALSGKTQADVRVAAVIGMTFDAQEKIRMLFHHRHDAVNQRLG